MGWLGWLIVIGGPAACAAAGALVAFLLTVRHYERRLDAVWDQAWDACLNSVAAQWQGYAVHAWGTAADRAQMALDAPTAAAAPLPALPALHHEGGRHERPQRPAQGLDDLAAIARVRAEFDLIRIRLGLRVSA